MKYHGFHCDRRKAVYYISKEWNPCYDGFNQITLANHLHHKEKRRLYKTFAYILRIAVYRDNE